MDGSVLLYIGLGLLFVFLVFWIRKPKKTNHTKQKKMEEYPSFDYDLEQIEIDNFHISEEVDIHSKYDSEYGIPHKSFGEHTIVDRKTMTTFKTVLFFKISYKEYSQEIKVELPVDHTIIRMKFYVQKNTKVYILEEANESTSPILLMDFKFLEFDFFNSLQINFKDGTRESDVKKDILI